MSSVEETLAAIVTKLDVISSEQKSTSEELKSFKKRVEVLESKSKSTGKTRATGSSPTPVVAATGTASGSVEPVGPLPTEPSSDEISVLKKSDELRQDFEAIRDSLIRVRLPNTYRLSENRSSIPSKDREQAAVLVRSARFVETNLKLLGEIQNNIPEGEGLPDVVAELLGNLLTTNAAAIRYMKEEYSSLYVGGEYGPKTKSIFKSLRKNTSNLEPDAIEDLKTAVQVSRPENRENTSGGPRFRGGFRPFGRGRGFRGRGTGYQQKNIPFQRDNNSLPAVTED